MKVFDTSVDRGGRTVNVSFRLDVGRDQKRRRLKVNIRKVIEGYLDNL